jgi:polar amino acid transport system substrate-binding protein
MTNRRVAAGLFLFCLVIGTAVTAFGANDKIVVVVDQNYPPYMFGVGTTQKADGLYPKLLEAIFTRIGIKVEIQALPWEEALKAGREGSAAVGGIYKNNARLEIYDFSEPLFEERLAVYVKKGETFHLTRLSDLQGKTIGLNRGWSYGNEFDTAREKYRFTVEEENSNLQNFKKLVSGKIDCLIADQVAASQIIRQEHWNKQIERLDKPAAVTQAYLAFTKRLKKQDLLQRFNQALADMKKDGSYDNLVQAFAAGSSR